MTIRDSDLLFWATLYIYRKLPSIHLVTVTIIMLTVYKYSRNILRTYIKIRLNPNITSDSQFIKNS